MRSTSRHCRICYTLRGWWRQLTRLATVWREGGVVKGEMTEWEQYTAALTLLSGPMDTARFGHKGPHNEEHFQALQNLLHPERVEEAANQVGNCLAGRGGAVKSEMTEWKQYTAAPTLSSGSMDTARFGHKGPNNEEHFQALQNLLHPERVVEAANQVCTCEEGVERGGSVWRRGSVCWVCVCVCRH